MNDQSKQAQHFLKLIENSIFNRREEIIEGIETGKLILENASKNEVPSKELLEIYRRRAKHLERYASEHSERLRKDTLAFCENLTKFPDEKVNFWRFKRSKVWGYTIFEGVEAQEILGCLFTADKRFASEDEWERIWNKRIVK